MLNPYIAGTPVSDESFYGRRDLLDFLLDKRRSVYLVGLRRSGKTSVLRRLEIESSEVALYLDWQFTGPNPLEMGHEVICQYRLRRHQYPQLPEVAFGKNDDVCAALAKLSQAAVKRGFQLLLLWDEAETLLDLDGAYLQRLRSALQGRAGIRSILAATLVLHDLDTSTRSWRVPLFLTKFETRYVTPLNDQDATDLIRQSKASQPQIVVTDDAVVQIRHLTGNQPYLIQYLCSSLFDMSGQLRPPPTEYAPMMDDHLSAILREDYDRLSTDEQEILHRVLEREQATESDLAAGLPLASGQLSQYLHALEQLGYLACQVGKYRISNRFLLEWLRRHSSLSPRPSDSVVEPGSSAGPSWNMTAMRELLLAAFGDEELTALCFDHFRLVFEGFSHNMSKSVKIQRLMEYCDRNAQMDALAQEIQARNPAQYKRFALRLRSTDSASTRKASDTSTPRLTISPRRSAK